MPTDHRAKLATIKRFDQLIAYLRDEMGWPIARDSFEEVDDLFYDFTADELGIDPKTAAKIQEIKRLRPLSPKQPWGIFFVKFEPKKLPVVALRRILSQVALKKRASANSAARAAWAADDLLFVSNYGEGDERQISFAHFARSQDGHDLPTLKVLGWNNLDTALHLDAVARELTEHLAWPDDDRNAEAWRARWRAAFSLGHHEVVTTSKELSIRLAELARAIRDRIKTALAIETDKGPLTMLMKAFQEALVHDLDADGFADMYAQTIAYGLLSARIADPHKKTADDFAAHMRTNPFLRELMETFLKVGGRRGKTGGPGIDFDELGVSEVIDLLDDANMEAVVRDFGDRNPQEDPVIHFYELFLKEYDVKKRMQRGVFYTPRPVVSYIVRSADELLRTEFGLVDGLADTTTWGEIARRYKDLKIPEGISLDQDFVQILDPATGTGTFLVEAIDLIHKTMVAKWKAQDHSEKKIEALWNAYVPKHLLTRLHGYEILMAPYAIAHVKFGLKLHETGYRFESDERARIYLTNALEPPSSSAQLRLEGILPALAREAQAVNTVKAIRRFSVVVGNPPYSVKSYNNGMWIRELLIDFKKGLNETKINLDDDYLKFLRLVAHLAESAGLGVWSMITNNSFLSGVTHRQVRRYLLETFASTSVANLHGDSRYGEVPPEGRKNENVFDIQQGVCISIFARPRAPQISHFSYGDVWGSRDEKYARLLSHEPTVQALATPEPPLWLFQPVSESATGDYDGWPLLTDWMPVSSNGIETHKDGLTVHFTTDELYAVVEQLMTLPVERARAALKIGDDGRDWSLREAVKSLKKMVRQGVKPTAITYRPFDVRYTMLNPETGGFLAYPRWEVTANLVSIRGNLGLVSARLMARGGAWDSCLATLHPTEKKTGDSTRSSTLFPLLVRPDNSLDVRSGVRPNFSSVLLSRVRSVCGVHKSDNELREARDVFAYLFALLHSKVYRERYEVKLRTGFPRLPLPGSAGLFRSLVALGAQLLNLHTMASEHLEKSITTYVGPTLPEVRRVAWDSGTVWLDAVTERAGGPTQGTVGFRGVPEVVWEFRIGGYQVCEKWLKDRRGRRLTKDDLAHYQRIVVALADIIRLMKEIDKVIETHGGWPGAFLTNVVADASLPLVAERASQFEACKSERDEGSL